MDKNYEKMDKRTKEYKEWKKTQESAPAGLGDSIEKITEATGIKKAVEFVAGEDCGCDERKKKLNNLFSYKKPECFTEDEYNYMWDLVNQDPYKIESDQQKRLLQIYNRVFKVNKRFSTCASCVRSMYRELKRYLEAYS